MLYYEVEVKVKTGPIEVAFKVREIEKGEVEGPKLLLIAEFSQCILIPSGTE
jgi:hypothetical protein